MIILKLILVAISFDLVNYAFYQIGKEQAKYEILKKLNERRYK